jgi:hypothetical protein
MAWKLFTTLTLLLSDIQDVYFKEPVEKTVQPRVPHHCNLES